MLKLSQIIGFDWDNYNIDKNWLKHRVLPEECEQVFFNKPIFIYPDFKHSQKETRFHALGKTHINRTLFIVFTVRRKKIRIISARDMNNKERKKYDKQEKTI